MKKFLVLLAVLLMPSVAEARHYRHHRVVKPACTFLCGPYVIPHTRGERVANHVGFGIATDNDPFAQPRPVRVHKHKVPRKHINYCGVDHCLDWGHNIPPAFGAPSNPVIAVARGVQQAATIVSHPDGCPRSAFCGCGAAVRVFGTAVRSLWLAANWYHFPRAMPAAGMVAVRPHHVFVLEADLGGGVWRVYDANSGGHATRIHARSIAGYTIVNPHGGRYG